LLFLFVILYVSAVVVAVIVVVFACHSEHSEEPRIFASAVAVVLIVAFASKVERGFSPASNRHREAATALPKAGVKAKP